MKTKLPFEFENIDNWNQRAKVIGGWIVKSTEPVYHLDNSVTTGGDGWDWRISITFVPDPEHKWEIEK